MSNSHSVPKDTAMSIASCQLQLLLAVKKLEGCKELEDQAWEEYSKAPTPRNLRTAAFVGQAVRSASAEADLARLQLDAVS